MRLIDADALKAKWYEINNIDETDRGARFVGYTEIPRLIDNAPTIEIVMCENCIYGSEDYPKDIFPDATGETYSCAHSTYSHDKDK